MTHKSVITKIFLIYILFLHAINLNAQIRSDVCTPKGNAVVAFITSENTNSMRAYYDAYYANAYPNAEQIITYDGYSSTRRFNCHGYAWHISDGGSARWIGYGSPFDNNPEYQYWQDGSYVEVSGYTPYPGKVNWASGDHSAITTIQSGVLISKWNEFPLMKHRWDDSPYGTSNMKYYKLNFSVTGPSIICSSNSYSLSNMPGGDVTWSESSNLSRLSSQGSIPCSFSAIGLGNGWIKATITNSCGNVYSIQKNLTVGPVVSFTWDGVGPYGQVNVTKGSSPYKFYRNGSLIYTSYSNPTTIPFGCSGGLIKVEANTSCGVGSATDLIPSGCYPLYFTVSPNPAQTEITINNVVQESSKQIETTNENSLKHYLSVEVELYEINGNVIKHISFDRNDSMKIDISGLKKGLYFFKIIADGLQETHQIIKN